MMVRRLAAPLIAIAMAAAPFGTAHAQFTVLDQAQDGGTPQSQLTPPSDSSGVEPALPAAADPAPVAGAAPAGPCGSQPFSIARMSWPSAALLAEIHARILTQAYQCQVRIVSGDLGATASSMGSTGQPAMAPEMWVTRIADVWNGATEAQLVRSAAPSYVETSFEGWYMPTYAAAGLPAAPAAARLTMDLPVLQPEGKVRFISCPMDWACSVINRNLLAAHGLDALVEIVEPANRFEMDRLIAEAVSRREPFLFYYWQPNAVLAQVDVVALDMGAYDPDAAKCLADRDCADPKISAFPTEMVVIAVAERVFADIPVVAGYFQRASLPLAEMDAMLAQLNEAGATPESVADRFIAEKTSLWQGWVGNSAP